MFIIAYTLHVAEMVVLFMKYTYTTSCGSIPCSNLQTDEHLQNSMYPNLSTVDSKCVHNFDPVKPVYVERERNRQLAGLVQRELEAHCSWISSARA